LKWTAHNPCTKYTHSSSLAHFHTELVLQALGLPNEVISGALRIGIGKFTTEEEIEQAAEVLSTAVSLTRKAMDV